MRTAGKLTQKIIEEEQKEDFETEQEDKVVRKQTKMIQYSSWGQLFYWEGQNY